MIKLVLFDFDGTIADTLFAGINIVNRNAHKVGIEKIKVEDIKDLKKLTLVEFCKKFNIPMYKIPYFLRHITSMLNKDIDKVPFFKGMDKVIEELYNKKYTIGILSSNTEENINKFLKAKNIKKYFSFVVSYSQVFGKSFAIKKISKNKGFFLSEIIYIGDEIRDINATKKIKIPIIAVSWGYNSIDVLKKSNPEFIAEYPKDILEVINNLNKDL
jgi:phosphoglycolate phosphatase